MPTITAGGSATFTSYDNGTVSVASNGGFASISITQVAGPAIAESWGPGPFRKVYGPFKEGATVTVSSQSADVNYDGAPIPADTSSLVSGAWTGLWANRAQALVAGVTAFFTDIGPGGSYWDYVGNKWRPQARRVVLYTGITPATLSSATKTVVDYATLQASLLQDGDILEYAWLAEKDGTSDTYTMDVCLGAVAATVGTSLGLSTGGLTGTARQLAPAAIRLRRESATSLRPVSVGGANATGTNTGANAAVTVPNMDSAATYLQLTGQRTSGTTETLTTRSLIVTLISGT